jgi:hypothetical protein
VSVGTFVIPFYYGYGSVKVCNFNTVPVPLRQKVAVPTVPVPQHRYILCTSNVHILLLCLGDLALGHLLVLVQWNWPTMRDLLYLTLHRIKMKQVCFLQCLGSGSGPRPRFFLSQKEK